MPPSDNNVHAVIQKRTLWIIFARSMIIMLKQELLITSHKTIDGRGANVHIAYSAGLTVQFSKNVIIHSLRIHDTVTTNGGMIRDAEDHFGFRTRSDGYGISVFSSVNVWINHISMSNCQDRLIDVIQGSTAITISNCHFTNHNDVMLLGASDVYMGDKIMQVTDAFNHFGRGRVQTMPRCRWGFFHIVNNDYTHWLMYAIRGSSQPTIISEGNRFITPPNVWKSLMWRSHGDLMMNGAFFVQSRRPMGRKPFRKTGHDQGEARDISQEAHTVCWCTHLHSREEVLEGKFLDFALFCRICLRLLSG